MAQWFRVLVTLGEDSSLILFTIYLLVSFTCCIELISVLSEKNELKAKLRDFFIKNRVVSMSLCLSEKYQANCWWLC